MTIDADNDPVDDTPDIADIANLLVFARRPEWFTYAACAGLPLDLFFPERGASGWHTLRTKAVCATCPVTAECLQMALDNNERHGIWGGMSVRQRRMLRRATPCETAEAS